MTSQSRTQRPSPSSESSGPTLHLETPSTSTDDQASIELVGSVARKNEFDVVTEEEESSKQEQHHVTPMDLVLAQVHQWRSLDTPYENWDLPHMSRPERVGNNPSSSSVSVSSGRSVRGHLVAVRRHVSQQVSERNTSSSVVPEAGSSSRGSHGYEDAVVSIPSPSYLSSSPTSSTRFRHARLLELWRQHESSFATFQFISGYSQFYTVPSISPEERRRVNVLSSSDLFLRARARDSEPQLPPIDASSTSDAVRALEQLQKAKDFWKQPGRGYYAVNALNNCLGLVQSMIRSRQPTVLSCVSVISSDLKNWAPVGFAESVLTHAWELAEYFLSKYHPLTTFLRCMRECDIDTQRQLTEIFLTRGIHTLREIDPNGLEELISNYEFQLRGIYEGQCRLDQAANLMNHRAYFYELHFGRYHKETVKTIYQIARVYFLDGKLVEAKSFFEDVLRRVPELPEGPVPRVWLLLNTNGRLAQVHKRLGNHAQARVHAMACLSGPRTGWEESADEWAQDFREENILTAEA